jgi:hypothetical protein
MGGALSLALCEMKAPGLASFDSIQTVCCHGLAFKAGPMIVQLDLCKERPDKQP